MPVSAHPKIYHIVHVDRLASIVADGRLLCDAAINSRGLNGTTIGMAEIKRRRLKLPLESHPNLHVGECVPFYFCPRSIMLYLIHQKNPELLYQGGQEPIVHLEADLHETVRWADRNAKRWAFTLSNAGAYYFEDRCSLTNLHEIDWLAVGSRYWRDCKEGKQAEFLVENSFPWHLIERIGLCSTTISRQTSLAIRLAAHKPRIEIQPNWYY
ncbi:MAG: hypothetical protein ACD_35C00035G0004 [uncultured bacterium]|nr:MAG: hypothetical protein ACD_35C00035G0004 [uncultured bacterium]